MRPRTSGHTKFLCVLFLLLTFFSTSPLQAEISRFDMVVQVNNFFTTIDEMDDLLRNLPGYTKNLSFREWAQFGTGTIPYTDDWIDDTRAFVIGISLPDEAEGTEFSAHLLLPFSEPNESFEANYGHYKGKNYYIVKEGELKIDLSRSARKILEKASVADTRGAFTVTISAGSILEKSEDKIIDAIDKIKSSPELTDQEELQPMDPEEIAESMEKMLSMVRQVDEYTIGLDFEALELVVYNDISATSGSDFAELLDQDKSGKSKLAGYTSDKQISFRVGSVNNQKMIELFDDMFGTMYNKVGIDLMEIAKMMENFSGEMAGGVSLTPGGLSYESIYVLKDAPKDFLEKTYIPWLLKYGKNIGSLTKEDPKIKETPLYVRTSGSMVSDIPVVGVKTQLPVSKDLEKAVDTKRLMELMTYEMRMTVVNDLLLIAPNDSRMKELITIAENLKEEKHKGPLVSVKIDPGAFFSGIMKIMPENIRDELSEFPVTEKMTFEMDVEDRSILTKTVINLEDIENMGDFFKEIEVVFQDFAGETDSSEKDEAKKTKALKTAPKKAKPVAEKVYDPTKYPKYWYDKGGLAATYGNDRVAIKHFKKALTMAPQNPDIMFSIGVSYGELGDHDQALSYINKALTKNPERGDFLYGRGRIHLLSGEIEKANTDFIGAAGKGNADAQRYLDKN